MGRERSSRRSHRAVLVGSTLAGLLLVLLWAASNRAPVGAPPSANVSSSPTAPAATVRSDTDGRDEPEQTDDAGQAPLGSAPSIAPALISAVAQFRALMLSNPLYSRWIVCADPECGVLLDELLELALSEFWHFVESDAFGLAGLSAENVIDEIERRLQLSSDDSERTAMLALLDRTPGIRRRVLPSALYALEGRTPTEARLILDRHGVMPLPSTDVVTRVSDLAVDPTRPDSLRYAALTALGHPTSGASLVERTLQLLRDGAHAGLIDRAGAAVGRCGWECRHAMPALLGSDDPAVRRTAYRGLALVPTSERSAVRAYLSSVRALARPAGADETEREEHMRFVALLGGI